MEEAQDINSRIDHYLLNQMQPDERAVFEYEMKQDPDLSEKVRIQGLITEEIQRREEFFLIMKEVEEDRNNLGQVKLENGKLISKSIVQNLDRSYDTVVENSLYDPELKYNEKPTEIIELQRKSIFYWRLMAIAAVAIGISIIVFWQPTKYSNKMILNSYAYNYVDESSIEQYWEEDTRSSAGSDINFSQQEVLVLVKAKALYENQHFELATAEFEKIGNLIKLNPDLSMLMAYSQLKAGMYEKASMNYSKLVQNSDISIQQEAKYYLALTLIGSNDRKGARIVLKDIIKSKELHSEDAKKILKTMRWF